MASGKAFSEETVANAGLEANLAPMSFSDASAPHGRRTAATKGAGLAALGLRGESEGEEQYETKPPINDVRRLRWAATSERSGDTSSGIDVVSRSEQSLDASEEAVDDGLPRLRSARV
jgi:hypothetical protein